MDLAGLRLRSQRLAGAQPTDPAAVVRALGAVQAQDYEHALWAVGVRLRAAGAADVVRAIEAARIVRTWPLRGTLHFVTAEDAAWMVRLTGPRQLAAKARRRRALGLGPAAIERALRVLADVLSVGPVPRAQVLARLAQAGVSTEGQRGYYLLFHAALAGLICAGPAACGQPTFVLLARWVKKPRHLDGEEALAELARRYVGGHGPVTERDFAWWAGLTLTEARAGLAAAGPPVVARTVEGVRYWWQPARAGDADEVQLLPGFDEYVLGYRDRGVVLADRFAGRIGGGVVRPALLVAGQVVGTWSARRRAGDVAITLSPFANVRGLLTRARPAAERYAEFLGLGLSGLRAGR